MGCCQSRSKVPLNIIPDPDPEEGCTFTIKSRGLFSSEYEVFKGELPVDESCRWLYITREGSFWDSRAVLSLENYVRGGDPEKPLSGQILWSASFNERPAFQQALRRPGVAVVSLGLRVGLVAKSSYRDDSLYIGGWGSDPKLIINWTMYTQAKLSSALRTGWGFPVRLRVFARGTAVARYHEHESVRFEGEGKRQRKIVTREWRHDTREYVDSIQFQIERADTGEPVVTKAGQRAVWEISGDINEYQANWSCPFFSVQQGGSWTGSEPPVVSTPAAAGIDPTLALMLAHLATHDFAPKGIKKALRPRFPHHPYNGVVIGIF